jgi:hypothetical protein
VISIGSVVPANRVDVGGRRDGGKCSRQCHFEARRSGSGRFLTGAEERKTKETV